MHVNLDRGPATGALLRWIAAFASVLLTSISPIASAQTTASAQDPGSLPATGQPAQQVNLTPPASLAALDKTLGVKGWNIPFPSFADTLLQDVGGVRSGLAEHGVGFYGISQNPAFYNVLDTPRSVQGQQTFVGQQFTAASSNLVYVIIDLSRYGIPDGQVVGEGAFSFSTFPNYIPRVRSLGSLSYYQTLLNGHVAIKVGYLSNGEEFVGTYVGGSLAGGVFGPSASIPYELGMSAEPSPAPGLNLTFNFTDAVYMKAGIQRSLDPEPNVFYLDKVVNPTGFRFTEPRAGALFIDELGYKRPASADQRQIWLRAGLLYNNSEYRNFSTGGYSVNSGFYVLGDLQFSRFDPATPGLAYRGIYGGVSVMHAAPDTNVFTDYLELRLYSFSPFKSRLFDLASLVATHSVFSKPARRPIEAVSAITGVSAQRYSDSITLSYSARVRAGLYVTPAINYTWNPSFTYTSKTGNALNLQAILTAFF